MAFLDNSGDIILDAVLTDTGRLALAKGNGSFRITQFAFADDEINYSLYNKNHPSGSAYYDLDILQTPVFEAFTNNISSVKYPLLSLQNPTLLYLPTLAINTTVKSLFSTYNTYLVGADSATSAYLYTSIAPSLDGYIPTNSNFVSIRIDQGIRSIGGPPKTISLKDDGTGLYEDQYTFQVDNKLLKLCNNVGNIADPSYIDDDGMATYNLSETSTANFIEAMKPYSDNTTDQGEDINTVIEGRRGSKIKFRLATTDDLRTSTYWFTNLGGETDSNFATALGHSGKVFYYIDTYIRITGIKTGASCNVPIRIIKFKS